MTLAQTYRRAPMLATAFGITSIASVVCTIAIIKIALQGGQVGDQFQQMVWVVFFGLGMWIIAGQIYDRMVHTPLEMENEMISTTELAASALMSPADMKTRAATIRRSTGSIKNEISGARYTQLSDREVKILADAADLLNLLASRYAGASETQKKGLDAREQRKRAVLGEIQGTFGQLRGDDYMCLVWSVSRAGFNRFALDGVVPDLDEPLDTIAFKCAQGAGDESAALDKAKEMWERFEREKGRWLVEARAAAVEIRG